MEVVKIKELLNNKIEIIKNLDSKNFNLYKLCLEYYLTIRSDDILNSLLEKKLREVDRNEFIYESINTLDWLSKVLPMLDEGCRGMTEFVEGDTQEKIVIEFYFDDLSKIKKGKNIREKFINELDIKTHIVNFHNFVLSNLHGFENKNTFLDLPANTQWKDIVIKWLDGHDILITLENDKRYKRKFNYKELGFNDYKRNIPNENWKKLEQTALNNGKMSWHGMAFVEKSRVQKRKQEIVKALKKAFGITDDPFITYQKEKEYIIKCELIFELSKTTLTHEKKHDYIGTNDYLEEEEERFNERYKKERLEDDNYEDDKY